MRSLRQYLLYLLLSSVIVYGSIPNNIGEEDKKRKVQKSKIKERVIKVDDSFIVTGKAIKECKEEGVL